MIITSALQWLVATPNIDRPTEPSLISIHSLPPRMDVLHSSFPLDSLSKKQNKKDSVTKMVSESIGVCLAPAYISRVRSWVYFQFVFAFNKHRSSLILFIHSGLDLCSQAAVWFDCLQIQFEAVMNLRPLGPFVH